LITNVPERAQLPQELLDFVEEWRHRPGNLIQILHRMQEIYGYIPRAEALELARVLDVPLAKIYGVITFYHFFKLKKPGRHNIQVCMGTACYLKGGQDIIEELENLLGIGINQTTDDGEFSIEAVRCVGCCGLSPVIVVDGEVHAKVTKDRLPEILASYRKN